jgi:glycerate 2-kinase
MPSPSFPLGLTPTRFINPHLRQHLSSIVSAALSAVDARRVTTNALLDIESALAHPRPVRAVAVGKAAVGMARAVEEVLGARVNAGLLTAPASEEWHGRWQAVPGAHPHPTSASEAVGRAALRLADETRQEDGVLLVCLSGGASAMMAVPAEGLTIEDKLETTRRLLRAGLNIGELNVVRRHLSAVKGGQLAARAGRSITLAISDVCTPVEDDPKVIGSGPTSGDDSTFRDALDVIDGHGVRDQLPAVVIAHLEAGAAGRVGGPVPSSDPRLRQAAYWIIGSRQDAMRGASETAKRLGYDVLVVRPPTLGEARDAAAALLQQAATLSRPGCLIASGETTVHVTGNGRGGRNQELAVAALESIAALAPAALASIGTDGVDGPTDAAGAFVDSTVWPALGQSASTEVAAALANNDVYPLLDRLGALIRTGPTGTNVGDMQIVLLAPA